MKHISEVAVTKPATKKTPSHIAYQVKDREGQKGIWTRIGAVWPHKDGKGFDAQLDAIPLDGRITFREPSEAQE